MKAGIFWPTAQLLCVPWPFPSIRNFGTGENPDPHALRSRDELHHDDRRNRASCPIAPSQLLTRETSGMQCIAGASWNCLDVTPRSKCLRVAFEQNAFSKSPALARSLMAQLPYRGEALPLQKVDSKGRPHRGDDGRRVRH